MYISKAVSNYIFFWGILGYLRYLTGWGNAHCGMHLLRQISVGHLSGRGNVRRGYVWSGKCPSGMCLVEEMSVGEVSVGEESVGEMSVGDVSGNPSSYLKVGKISYINLLITASLPLQDIFTDLNCCFIFPFLK